MTKRTKTMNETITAEYIQAITGTNRRHEVLTIIAEYCRTVSADERTIIEKFFDSENQIDFRRNLFQCGISLKMNEAKNLLQIILRPIAAELGIRITGEPTGDAAAIIAEARKRYAEQQATLARRAASNPNETRGRPRRSKRYYRTQISLLVPVEVVPKHDTLSF